MSLGRQHYQTLIKNKVESRWQWRWILHRFVIDFYAILERILEDESMQKQIRLAWMDGLMRAMIWKGKGKDLKRKRAGPSWVWAECAWLFRCLRQAFGKAEGKSTLCFGIWHGAGQPASRSDACFNRFHQAFTLGLPPSFYTGSLLIGLCTFMTPPKLIKTC